jgi:molecular chaperone IbpA
VRIERAGSDIFGFGQLLLREFLLQFAAKCFGPSRESSSRPIGGYPAAARSKVRFWAEDRYQISLAVAGFSPDEIAITAEQSVLTAEGRKAEKQQREFLYQGISSRPFKRQYNLADYVQIKGAAFDNGLLQIELVHEIPEAMKPRRISIAGSSASVRQIDGKAAA